MNGAPIFLDSEKGGPKLFHECKIVNNTNSVLLAEFEHKGVQKIAISRTQNIGAAQDRRLQNRIVVWVAEYGGRIHQFNYERGVFNIRSIVGDGLRGVGGPETARGRRSRASS